MTPRRVLPAVAALAAIGAASASAQAAVERYAVLVGNNLGAPDEGRLRFAEQDAIKVQGVLRDLGGFRPENIVLLRGENADAVRSAIISVNQRIRGRVSEGGTETVLFVYYSGHADSDALHLGGSILPVREVRDLVAGSASTFRLLVVDACRSGSLTQSKGRPRAPPFTIQVEQVLGGEGAAFLTSSALDEDAQESDEIRGSFFTHYLTTGLLGAADADRDQRVTLGEAYRFAYEETLRATSRTLAGPQHPSFRYLLSGQGDLVLTDLGSHASERSTLALPGGRSFLVIAGSAEGPIVGEIGPYERARELSLRPGSYFVRGRGSDDLLEGTVALVAGEHRQLQENALERTRYARLVRKGRGEPAVHGPMIGYRARSSLSDGTSLCQGVVAGYVLDLQRLSLGARVNACRATRDANQIYEQADELTATIRLAHAWDLPAVTVELGILGGGGVLRQTFSTSGRAPNRSSATGILGAGGAVTRDLPRGLAIGLEAAALTYLYRLQSSEPPRTVRTAETFAVELGLVLSKRW